MLLLAENSTNGEIDDGKGQSTDNKADNSVKDSIFSFLNFTGVTGRSHVINAADNDEDNGDDATDADNNIKDVLNDIGELTGGTATAARSSFDFGRNAGVATDVFNARARRSSRED